MVRGTRTTQSNRRDADPHPPTTWKTRTYCNGQKYPSRPPWGFSGDCVSFTPSNSQSQLQPLGPIALDALPSKLPFVLSVPDTAKPTDKSAFPRAAREA
ncbi:hypothetical protein CC2G_009902 [Coprinopsis cinerea AmutBmut pab1-1]|nr:hypothetical protein CC2G_009902 [Coprinopsis cinerea AmutBmut pab1-1]